MIGRIENGNRQMAPDIAPTVASKLDHPAVYMEMARELTGGYGPAWLDGPNVDLHRAVVRERCLEETEEALMHIRKACTCKPPAIATEGEQKIRRSHLIQVLDAIEAMSMYVGVQCLEYEFSVSQLYREHHRKLESLRYKQKDPRANESR